MQLKRFNEILGAMVGTVVLLLLVFFGITALVRVLRPQTQIGMTLEKTEGKNLPQNLFFCLPISLPGSDIEFVPVGAVAATNAQDNPSLNSQSAIRQYERPFAGARLDAACELASSFGRLFNVVVVNVTTGEQRLLLSKPALIVSMSAPSERCRDGEGSVPCGAILWGLLPADTNHDGVLDSRDAQVDYLSDLAANDFRPVTPLDVTVLGSIWNAKMNTLTFAIRRDSNADGKFTLEDGSELLEVSLAKAQTRPLIAPAVLERLRNALH